VSDFLSQLSISHLFTPHGSERIFIFIGGKKGIYIISLLYFTNEESLGRRSQFDGFKPEATKRESLSGLVTPSNITIVASSIVASS
jgi:hypothetical protein